MLHFKLFFTPCREEEPLILSFLSFAQLLRNLDTFPSIFL